MDTQRTKCWSSFWGQPTQTCTWFNCCKGTSKNEQLKAAVDWDNQHANHTTHENQHKRSPCKRVFSVHKDNEWMKSWENSFAWATLDPSSSPWPQHLWWARLEVLSSAFLSLVVCCLLKTHFFFSYLNAPFCFFSFFQRQNFVIVLHTPPFVLFHSWSESQWKNKIMTRKDVDIYKL